MVMVEHSLNYCLKYGVHYTLLGGKAKGRGKIKSETGFELREQQAAYGNFDLYNTFYWDR